MTIKTKLRKAAAALTALCLIAGCTTKPKDPEVYIDDKNEEIVLTLFAQGEVVANLIQQCFNEVINRKQEKTFILYSDSASFYADEGLSYRELLLKRLESGEADDLFIIPAEDVLEFDRKGYLYDLSDMDFIHNLSADALQQSTYDNKVFSLPLSYTAFGLLWNVDLLHQYDLEVPQTLSEFLTVCETLKQNGIVPYGANMDYGLSIPVSYTHLSQWIRMDNATRITMTPPTIISSLTSSRAMVLRISAPNRKERPVENPFNRSNATLSSFLNREIAPLHPA